MRATVLCTDVSLRYASAAECITLPLQGCKGAAGEACKEARSRAGWQELTSAADVLHPRSYRLKLGLSALDKQALFRMQSQLSTLPVCILSLMRSFADPAVLLLSWARMIFWGIKPFLWSQ